MELLYCQPALPFGLQWLTVRNGRNDTRPLPLSGGKSGEILKISRSEPLSTADIPVNRTLVGVISAVCLAAGIVLWVASSDQAANLWPGALVRVGTVMGALWLALPTRHREAAWARVSIWKVLGTVLALVVIVRTRIPLQYVMAGGLLFVVSIVLLRPRQPQRPALRR